MTLAPIAMFARNEERKIRGAIESVLRCFEKQTEFEPALYVLVHGSTDGTAAIVRELASRHPAVRLIEIARRDKSEAWNHYVFDIAPRADAHIFMDGGVVMGARAGPELLRVLARAPEALACVAMPTGGRNSSLYQKELIARPAIGGNLYALKEASLQMFRDKGGRLPLGQMGEDVLIGFLVAKDLDPSGPLRPERTVAAEQLTVSYEPMRWLSLHDIRKYCARRVDQSVRFHQLQLLGPRLKSGGMAAMPRDITEIYGDMDTYKRPVRGGLSLFFDWIAWGRMKRARDAFRGS
jgi:glycosyltransferase involved in cell wall biosynthesis